MTKQIETEHDARLHQLCHDVGNCLHIISIGTQILKDAQGDDLKFAEVFESLEQEHRTAVNLLREFLNSECAGCE